MNRNIDIKSILKNSLKPILEEYNKCIIDDSNNVYIDNTYHIIPNNNNKFFLFITNKKKYEQYKSGNILYFFQNDNTLTDFYFETSLEFENEILFEGYLYNDNTSYLISDLLYNNSVVINEYTNRFKNIKKLITSNIFQNCTINFNLHCNFINTSQNINIFINNFIYKNEIVSMEHIKGLTKTRILLKNNKDNVAVNKRLEKTKYTEVYNVYNTENGNKEGVLYVKNIQESKILKNMFIKDSCVIVKCIFNKQFNKWKIV